METSLRYNDDSKSLILHAKQTLPIDSDTFLLVRGELDTKSGGPNYLSAMLRRFYNPPQLAASLCLGVQFDHREKLGYVVRGEMGFPVLSDESVRFNVKGRCDVDKDLKQRKSKGSVDVSWSVLSFQKDQDVRFKVGFDIVDKVELLSEERRSDRAIICICGPAAHSLCRFHTCSSEKITGQLTQTQRAGGI